MFVIRRYNIFVRSRKIHACVVKRSGGICEFKVTRKGSESGREKEMGRRGFLRANASRLGPTTRKVSRVRDGGRG